MTITKEKLKAAIDKVPDEYLEILYRILKAFEIPIGDVNSSKISNAGQGKTVVELDWHQFIKETYGSLADAPIKRGNQGKFEHREDIE